MAGTFLLMAGTLLFSEFSELVSSVSQDPEDNAAGWIITITMAFIGEDQHLSRHLD
jgi:hypothetical protein